MITETMLKHWASLTLREGLSASPLNAAINWQSPSRGRSEKASFIQHLIGLRRKPSDFVGQIFKSSMTGALSQGWRDMESSAIFFQDCLAAVNNAYPGQWTPADYLLQCYIAGKKGGFHVSEMDLGRALRNLPSFLREYLIAGKLDERDHVSVEIPSELMNAKYHVDLILHIRGEKIYIWSYLATQRAIRHLTESKISEKRGSVLLGTNLLAPFEKSKDADEFLEWWVPSKAYIDGLLQATTLTPMSYKELAIACGKDDKMPFYSFLKFVKTD